MKRSFLTISGAAALALFAACGGGGSGSNGASSTGTDGGASATTPSSGSSAPLSSAVSGVPVAGQFLAECFDDGVAVISSFASDGPIASVLPADLPTFSEVIASADLSLLPVIGGLVPDPSDPSALVPVSADDILSLFPGGTIPGTLPVLGEAPINCSATPLTTGALPDPTDALGLIPVVGPSGDVIGLILATASNLQSGSVPGLPATPTLTAIELPGATLPEPIGSVVGTLLGLLGL